MLLAKGITEDDRVRRLVRAAQERGVVVERVPRPELDSQLGPVNHQGVALLSSPFPYVDLADIAQRPGTVLVLDHLQDPQNFGTLLRSAEASGVAGVVIPRDRAVEVTPAVVNASAGAVEHLMVTRVANLPRALDDLRHSGRWVLGLDSGEGALDLFASDLPLPAALVVGSEGKGLAPLVRRSCDLILEIPMRGIVDSLNAATAGSIALYEIMRRTRTPS